MGENKKKVFLETRLPEIFHDLGMVGAFTKELWKFAADAKSNCTFAELKDLEFVADSLRRSVLCPAVFWTSMKLARNGKIDGNMLEKIGIIEKTQEVKRYAED